MSLLVETSDVLPLVDVEVAFPVGSLQDPTGKEGLAQITGHLVRRGPRGISQQRFEDRLASLGARVSVEVSMRSCPSAEEGVVAPTPIDGGCHRKRKVEWCTLGTPGPYLTLERRRGDVLRVWIGR